MRACSSAAFLAFSIASVSKTCGVWSVDGGKRASGGTVWWTNTKFLYYYHYYYKEEDKKKDGKTSSENGLAYTSTAVREQPRTVRDGRRLSPMSAVVPLRPRWFRDTGKVTGNIIIIDYFSIFFINLLTDFLPAGYVYAITMYEAAPCHLAMRM